MAELRSRRSNLAVPGSNPRFLEKAKGLPADQVFLDLPNGVPDSVYDTAAQVTAARPNCARTGGASASTPTGR